MKKKTLSTTAATAIAVLLAGCVSIPRNVVPFNEVEQRAIASNEVRAIQVSDCHFTKEKPLFDALAETINRLDPAVVFLTGDQAVSAESIKVMEHYLKKIDVACPKFAINGNWERLPDREVSRHFGEYTRALEKSGFVLLVNSGRTLDLGGKRIVVYGLDSLRGGKPSFEGFVPEADAANVILGHCPVLFDRLPDSGGIPLLMLSGHTHGGQVLLFGKAVCFPEGTGQYYAGIYKKEGNTLYVSTGVGNSSMDIRNLPPSIEVITFTFDGDNKFAGAEFQTIEIPP